MNRKNLMLPVIEATHILNEYDNISVTCDIVHRTTTMKGEAHVTTATLAELDVKIRELRALVPKITLSVTVESRFEPKTKNREAMYYTTLKLFAQGYDYTDKNGKRF